MFIRSIILAALFIPAAVLAQKTSKADTSGICSAHSKPGPYFLDAVPIDAAKYYLDPDNIKSIKAAKDKNAALYNGTRGVILITRKKKTPLASLADLEKKYPNPENIPVKFMIDGKAISDTANVRFEPAAAKKIEINKITADKSIHTSSLILFAVITKSKKIASENLFTKP